MSFYDDASWLLIPSGIEEDIVFAQKPISGLGDLTFTRASDATYTDASGVVRRSPYNLLQDSEMYSTAYWAKNASTISANVANAPNGTLTADKIIPAATNAFHSISSPYTLSTQLSRTITLSAYLKADGYNFGALIITSGPAFANFFEAVFNLSNGTVENTGRSVGGYTGTASIQSVGNGYYRCSITLTNAIANTTHGVLVLPQATNDPTVTYTGNGTSGIIIWGAQLVEGTEPLDYFPTTNRQDVPRIDFRNADGTLSSCGRLLLEPQRTNSIRNSSMVGAVAGTPGTLPTNWTNVLSGLTQTVVGVGTENGLPYIDFRFNGTATNTTCELRFETNTQIAALTGQVWTLSTYAKVISGTFNSASLFMFERTSAGIAVASGSQGVTVTSTLQRLTYTRTLSGGATVGAVQPAIVFFITNGAAYDFTIRIAAPQMELGAYATTWVPTTTAAVTRLADSASKTGVSSLIGQTEGTMFFDFYLSNVNATTNRVLMYILSSGNPPTNGIRLEMNATSGLFAVIRSNNSNTLTTAPISLSAGNNRIALSYKSGDIAIYINGIQAITSTVSFTFTTSVDKIALENSTAGANTLSDGVSQAALFPTRLTNAQLAQLTTL